MVVDRAEARVSSTGVAPDGPVLSTGPSRSGRNVVSTFLSLI
jgi:hypothetical protein